MPIASYFLVYYIERKTLKSGIDDDSKATDVNKGKEGELWQSTSQRHCPNVSERLDWFGAHGECEHRPNF